MSKGGDTPIITMTISIIGPANKVLAKRQLARNGSKARRSMRNP